MRFYITYGQHTNLRNNFSVVTADSADVARQQVFDTIGPKWAFLYTEKEFEGQAERFGLTEVPLQVPMPNMSDYLGDGVYVDFDGFQIWLKANNPIHPTDRIALDPSTVQSLLRYIERLRDLGMSI